jgi:hypothetical protein
LISCYIPAWIDVDVDHTLCCGIVC